MERAVAFIRAYCHQAGLNKVVLGLSGGIDSSLSAALAVQALGKENVLGLLLPYRKSSAHSTDDATVLAESLGIKTKTIDISPMVDAYFAMHQEEADSLRKGNFMARMRMSVLYDFSSQEAALVLGTSNRTELLVGYFTQFGDGACAFEPIGHLYKTEVRILSQVLDLPQSILNKAPTADLWEGQTDEGELGITYPVLDEILYQLTEQHIEVSETAKLDYPLASYQHVMKLVSRSEYKRQLPPVLE
ncbi:MAG TPA: NAD+ synthase [Candidatus Cloacimonadota bacterium]|nr:NAD+ synthase [Candidatus Cloacimonadota bacterium]